MTRDWNRSSPDLKHPAGRAARPQAADQRPPQAARTPRGAWLATLACGSPPVSTLLMCGLLMAAVWAVFGQTLGHGFVRYDDQQYVFENPHVIQGATRDSIGWAFTSTMASNWHPLTWISHMIDVDLYGLWPGGHHATNVLLHALNAAGVFLVFSFLTGEKWRSACVAGLFAVHPQRVESVAWVAERKDLLCGLFFLLTLAAYKAYVRNAFSWRRYLSVVALFAAGLMCKPMLVTLPGLLLLLDYWPLQRFGRSLPPQTISRPGIPRLLAEKVPLVMLAAASCLTTMWAQRTAMDLVTPVPLSYRIGNAVVASVAYLGQAFWPVRLSAFYPHPRENLSLGLVAVSAVLLCVVTIAALWTRRRCPYLIVGWLWYLGMIVPVAGLVQVGLQAMADRYTYLPLLGPSMAVVWGAAEWSAARPRARVAGGIACLVAVGALAALAFRQTACWRDDQTLWTQALECNPHNYKAHLLLGKALVKQQAWSAAIEHFREAIKSRPNYAEAYRDLGRAYADVGEPRLAAAAWRLALQLEPADSATRNNLGLALAQTGQYAEACTQFAQVLATDPRDRDARWNLGAACQQQRKYAQAFAHWRAAVDANPDDAPLRIRLAWEITHCPDPALRNAAEAVQLAQQAVALTANRDPTALRALAMAYGQAGQPAAARAAIRQALALPDTRANRPLEAALQQDLSALEHVPPSAAAKP